MPVSSTSSSRNFFYFTGLSFDFTVLGFRVLGNERSRRRARQRKRKRGEGGEREGGKREGGG